MSTYLHVKCDRIQNTQHFKENSERTGLYTAPQYCLFLAQVKLSKWRQINSKVTFKIIKVEISTAKFIAQFSVSGKGSALVENVYFCYM